jgi:hypothetical protein
MLGYASNSTFIVGLHPQCVRNQRRLLMVLGGCNALQHATVASLCTHKHCSVLSICRQVERMIEFQYKLRIRTKHIMNIMRNLGTFSLAQG